MEEIAKKIYNYSLNFGIADEKFLFDLFYSLLMSLKINKNIKVQFSNEGCAFLIRYYPEENKVYINYKKLLIILKKIVMLERDLDYQNSILYFNTKFLEAEVHEIQHIIQQFKISECDGTFECNMLIASDKKEQLLKKCGLYDSLKYVCNPLERQANIISTQYCSELIRNYYNRKVGNIFERELEKKMVNGYNYNDYPARYFFDSFLINELNNNVMNEQYFTRLQFGLKISEHEYYNKLLERRYI